MKNNTKIYVDRKRELLFIANRNIEKIQLTPDYSFTSLNNVLWNVDNQVQQ